MLVIFKTLDVAFQVWDSVEDTLEYLHTVNISFNVRVSFDVPYSGDCICRMAPLAQHSTTYLLLEHAKPNTSKGILVNIDFAIVFLAIWHVCFLLVEAKKLKRRKKDVFADSNIFPLFRNL